MLKHLAILAVLASAICVSAQPNKTSDNKHQPAAQREPAISSAHGEDEQQSTQKHQTSLGSSSLAGNAAIERSDWWNKPDWWILAVTMVTAGVIAWQAWETRKAAEGTKDAAIATRENTDIAISQNRPYLRLHRVYFNREGKPGLGPLYFTIRLYGSTPAFIDDFQAWVYVIQNRDPKSGHLLTDWKTKVSIPEVITPDDQEYQIRFEIRPKLTEDEIAGVERLEAHLHCDGIIHYRDVFGKVRNTKFSQLYSVLRTDVGMEYAGLWIRCGQEEHNECT